MAEISSSVKKYVEANDVKSTRIALTTIGYIADYESFNSFKVSTEYAVNKLFNLFEPDNNEVIDFSVSQDSYKKIVRQLMSNFSEKKYRALIEVGTKLYSKENQKTKILKNDDSYKSSRNREKLDPFLTKKPSLMQNLLDSIIQHPIIVLGIIVALAVVIVIATT